MYYHDDCCRPRELTGAQAGRLEGWDVLLYNILICCVT